VKDSTGIEITFSRYSTFTRCPFWWFRKYYIGGVQEFQSGPQIIGIRLHEKIMNWLMKKPEKFGAVGAIDYEVDKLFHAWRKVFSKYTGEMHVEAERAMDETFTPIGWEQRESYAKQTGLITFASRADADFIKDDTLHIFDWKTGWSKFDIEEKSTVMQFLITAWIKLAYARHDKHIQFKDMLKTPPISKFKFHLLLLREKYSEQTFSLDIKEVLGAFSTFMRYDVKEMLDVYNAPIPSLIEKRRGNHCKFCPIAYDCSAYRDKTLALPGMETLQSEFATGIHFPPITDKTAPLYIFASKEVESWGKTIKKNLTHYLKTQLENKADAESSDGKKLRASYVAVEETSKTYTHLKEEIVGYILSKQDTAMGILMKLISTSENKLLDAFADDDYFLKFLDRECKVRSGRRALRIEEVEIEDKEKDNGAV